MCLSKISALAPTVTGLAAGIKVGQHCGQPGHGVGRDNHSGSLQSGNCWSSENIHPSEYFTLSCFSLFAFKTMYLGTVIWHGKSFSRQKWCWEMRCNRRENVFLMLLCTMQSLRGSVALLVVGLFEVTDLDYSIVFVGGGCLTAPCAGQVCSGSVWRTRLHPLLFWGHPEPREILSGPEYFDPSFGGKWEVLASRFTLLYLVSTPKSECSVHFYVFACALIIVNSPTLYVM